MPLQLEAVTHRYPKSHSAVLTKISLTVPEGQSLAVMGPSGSGKTTLLSIAGGVLRPTVGRAILAQEGRKPEEASKRPGAFGWVFQTANAFLSRSVADNVAMALIADGLSHQHARAQARKSLSQVGLTEMADRAARTLSGGELQRMCIARAIVTSPTVVLADEPTGQLDRQTSIRTMETMLAVVSERSSLLVATHDEQLAHRCSHVVRLADGHLESVR